MAISALSAIAVLNTTIDEKIMKSGAFRVAEEALERQIPAKPVCMSTFWGGVCPKCGACIEHKKKYCSNCGQRIDWGCEDEQQ